MTHPSESILVPGAEPFLFRGGKTGCILVHGFTAMPEEMRLLGEFLAAQGHTVLGLRLAGHAAHPSNLSRVRWQDWLADIEDGLALLRPICDHLVLIGQSMGAALALLAAARYPITAVAALSTPFEFAGRLVPGLNRLPLIEYKDRRRAAEYRKLRREPHYPAYPWYPLAVTYQLRDMLTALPPALPLITAPVMLIHSSTDFLPVSGMQAIFNRLTTADRRQRVFENMDHSLVRDPQRMQVFTALEEWIRSVTEPG